MARVRAHAAKEGVELGVAADYLLREPPEPPPKPTGTHRGTPFLPPKTLAQWTQLIEETKLEPMKLLHRLVKMGISRHYALAKYAKK